MRVPLPFLAKLGFSLLLLGMVFLRIDFQKLPDYFAVISPSALLWALLLAMLQVPATSLRWHLLLRTVGIQLPMRTTLEVNILSIFANTVLVNVIGGIATRVGFLLNHKIPTHSILSTSLLERLVIAIVLGGMTFVGLWLSNIHPHLNGHMLLRMVAFSLVGLVFLGLAAYAMSRQFRSAVERINLILLGTLGDIWTMIVDWRGLMVAFLLTFVSQMMLVGVGVMIGDAMHVAISSREMALILPGVALISSLPISLGGIGLREISMISILGILGVSAEQSLILSITIGAVTLGGSALAYGLVLAIKVMERR